LAHVFDVLEIHGLSNRPQLAVKEARFSPSSLRANLQGLFGSTEWRLFLCVLVATVFLRLRGRTGPLALRAPLLLLLGATCAFGLVIFELPRHQARMSVLALFPGAIWFALAAAELARRMAPLVGRRGDEGSLLAGLALLGVGGALYGVQADPDSN